MVSPTHVDPGAGGRGLWLRWMQPALHPQEPSRSSPSSTRAFRSQKWSVSPLRSPKAHRAPRRSSQKRGARSKYGVPCPGRSWPSGSTAEGDCVAARIASAAAGAHTRRPSQPRWHGFGLLASWVTTRNASNVPRMIHRRPPVRDQNCNGCWAVPP